MRMLNRIWWYFSYVSVFLPGLIFTHATQASDAPLVYANNLEYVGAFKVPTGDDMSYGGSVITYNPTKNSIYIVGNSNDQKVAEISIPEIVQSNDLATLNRATYLQTPSDITEGNRRNIAEGGSILSATAVNLGGLLVYKGNLIGTSFAFYSYDAVLSHFTSGLTLSALNDFSGMYAVGAPQEVPTASFVSGWMTHVPSELQSELGGAVITGNGGLSILGRTSFGPSAFSFDPSNLVVDNPAPATALLYYPNKHQTLNLNGYNNPIFNDTTKIAGMTMVNGSRSILYFGYHGIGENNYGQPSGNPIYADTCTSPDNCIMGPKGWPICEDPNNCITGRKGVPFDPECNGSGADGCYFDPLGLGGKGPHAFPYVYQVWAYDSNELVEVKAGTKKPWEVLPYATWQLPFSVVARTTLFGGATAYDASTGRLFVVQPNGELYKCCQKLPVIHVFQINLNATTKPEYHVGGKVLLLNGSVSLRNNGSDEVIVTSDDRSVLHNFSFSTPLKPGESYRVTVSNQSAEGKICKVMHGSGTIHANADIENIVIYCNGSKPKSMPPNDLIVM